SVAQVNRILLGTAPGDIGSYSVISCDLRILATDRAAFSWRRYQAPPLPWPRSILLVRRSNRSWSGLHLGQVRWAHRPTQERPRAPSGPTRAWPGSADAGEGEGQASGTPGDTAPRPMDAGPHSRPPAHQRYWATFIRIADLG